MSRNLIRESERTRRNSGLPLDPRAAAGFLAAVVAVVMIALLSYLSLEGSAASARSLARSIETMAQIQTALSTLKDAETGQRGYLLTGREAYLEPFLAAKSDLDRKLTALERLTSDSPAQRARFEALRTLATEKMDELQKTVDLQGGGRSDLAMSEVQSDRGKRLMDSIRSVVDDMENSERDLIAKRTAEWQHAARLSFGVTWGGSALLLVLIATSATFASRDYRARQFDRWLGAGQIGLSELLRGDQRLEELGRNALGFLAGYLGAQVGALVVAESGRLRRVAGYGIPAGVTLDLIRPGDGMVGEVAKSNRALHVRDLPAGYLPAGSGLGSGDPGQLLIAPASIDGMVQAVVELGFFGQVDPSALALLERVGESLGVAIRAARDRGRLEELLEETQRQAGELQTREEELRVNNEELEEQGRTLKESRSQLESQQVELEQINSQLEEQTEALQRQKDELAKSHEILSKNTADLRRANEYKSEFLANMSHELRTPLNSTLILAKLLADNKDGNLSDAQVKFAQTISAAGNDLLTLINDVLDLSRIEAGKIDLSPEIVSIPRLFETLATSFQASADQKKLAFSTGVDVGTPSDLETDPQRLGQILKNLLSNALKFTTTGEVSLRAFASADRGVCFAVRDTGVGIAPDQQEVIFEAFRQADGSIHRKYGGTGLGLSISKDLARLLGGTIGVRSAPGKGSVFTLTLPLRHSPAAADQSPPPAHVPAPAPRERWRPPLKSPVEKAPAAVGIEDDRHGLSPGARMILVIEDDPSFALILRDLAREMGFQCVVTQSAGDGIDAATRYLPSAILLDINLPDHSGLGVLDQLKHNPATRHIPVHVASVEDYRREALALGAVGYALKPVKREDLVEALRLLAQKSEQGLRRVLVVEDDPRQRDSIRQLLANDDVQIIAVESAGAALERLGTTTFDCVVMDLNLPDTSGYSLLETMAQQDDIAFPPVIVYTGRALSTAEEQRLRRHSKSIIIKDARSPERLLDEVTLFLHQVESKLPPDRQQMLRTARDRDRSLEGRRVLVVEDDVRNIFALSSVLESKGATIEIARNGVEAIEAVKRGTHDTQRAVDMVLMDIMMPEMDGYTAMREIRRDPRWKKLPIIALTARAMRDDQEKCLAAGANDYIAKPLDVEKLLSLVRVWMPK